MSLAAQLRAGCHCRPPVAIAAALLLAGVAGMNLAVFGVRGLLHKPAVPLVRELGRIPPQLGVFELVGEQRLAPQTERVLGTDNYLMRTYRDTQISHGEPGSGVALQVVYYSGTDQTMWVRHTPDACYVGSGMTEVESVESVIELPATVAGATLPARLPVHLFRYHAPETPDRVFTAVYFFVVNGRFAAGKKELRLSLMDVRSPHAYYCKIEIQPGRFVQASDDDGARLRFAEGIEDGALSLSVVGRFLAVALPEIVECMPTTLRRN